MRALLLVYLFLHAYMWCTNCIALCVNIAGYHHHTTSGQLHIICRITSSLYMCVQVCASGRTKYNHTDECSTATNRSAFMYWLCPVVKAARNACEVTTHTHFSCPLASVHLLAETVVGVFIRASYMGVSHFGAQ